ncbi:MAG: hypothetical protein ACRCTE_10920, partial [Cellulosilyticaceae bacterium]
FLPSQTELVEGFLEQLIDESGHTHYKASQLPAGMTIYLEDIQIEKRNVLIGNVTGQEQLEGIKKHLIYHIPLSKVRGRMLGIEYIAIYGSKSYGIGGIRYWGKVNQLQVMPRHKLLKQFPNSRRGLDEEYVVYTLEALEVLGDPILADQGGLRDRRYTNKTLLHYAKGLSELGIKTTEEFELHMTLRRLMEDYRVGNIEDTTQYVAEIGDAKVYVIEGSQVVIEKELETRYISLADISQNLVREIKNSVFAKACTSYS